MISWCMACKCAFTLLAMLALGCAPKETDTANETASASNATAASTDTASTSSATETTMASGVPTTGDTGAPSCQPPPLVGEACVAAGATKASWDLVVGGNFMATFDAMCSVEDDDDDGETQTLTFACDSEVVSLTLISAAPHVPVLVVDGAMVHLQLTEFPTLERVNNAFALRDADERLLAAGLKNAILPQPSPLQISPLTFELIASDCETTDDGCWVDQRAGLAVTLDATTAVVFDGNSASVGLQDSFQILVGRATRNLCTGDCEFNYEGFGTDALIVARSEG